MMTMGLFVKRLVGGISSHLPVSTCLSTYPGLGLWEEALQRDVSSNKEG